MKGVGEFGGGFWVSQDVRIWALFTLRIKREGVKGSLPCQKENAMGEGGKTMSQKLKGSLGGRF